MSYDKKNWKKLAQTRSNIGILKPEKLLVVLGKYFYMPKSASKTKQNKKSERFGPVHTNFAI